MNVAYELQINQMAAHFGVSTRTLRFYEQIGLLQPKRLGSRRLYSTRDQIRLNLIQKGKRFGFTLGEIAEFLAPYEQPEKADLPLNEAQLGLQIERLTKKREEIEGALKTLKTRLG